MKTSCLGFLLVAVMALASCSGESGATESAAPAASSVVKTPDPGPAATAVDPVDDAETARIDNPEPKWQDAIYVQMDTSEGQILLELDPEHAPRTVENFMAYVDSGFYDGTIFHRVIDGFMIQGGGFTADMTRKETRAPIVNEWRNGLKNKSGTIAMARMSDPNSATAQFFINVKDNDNLDKPISGGAGYAVFGKVVLGSEVVDKIRGAQTGIKKGRENVPIDPITINKVNRIGTKAALVRIKQGG